MCVFVRIAHRHQPYVAFVVASPIYSHIIKSNLSSPHDIHDLCTHTYAHELTFTQLTFNKYRVLYEFILLIFR